MTVITIMLAPLMLAVVAYLAGRGRRGVVELDERRRLEAMDERLASARLYPEHRIEVAPRRPPAP